jgi:hypothetical protein
MIGFAPASSIAAIRNHLEQPCLPAGHTHQAADVLSTPVVFSRQSPIAFPRRPIPDPHGLYNIDTYITHLRPQQRRWVPCETQCVDAQGRELESARQGATV